MVVACFRVVGEEWSTPDKPGKCVGGMRLQACPVTQPCLTLWNGLPFPSTGALSDPGIKPASPELTGGFCTTEAPGKPLYEAGVSKLHDVLTLKWKQGNSGFRPSY